MTRPPVRWTDSTLPEELSRAIGSAGATRSDAAAIERMRARLRDSLGPAFERTAPDSGFMARAASILQRGKWLGAAALTSAGLAFFGVRSITAIDPSSQPSAAAWVAPTSAAIQTEPTSGLQAQQADAAPLAQPSALDTPPGRAPALPEQLGAERKARHKLGSRGARATAAAPSGDDAARDRSATAAQPGLAEEVQGLAEIRALLETAPARALNVAQQQQQRFARGALGPERELLRIEALLRTGQAREAKLRATRAFNAASNPPYRAQIEKLFARAAAAEKH